MPERLEAVGDSAEHELPQNPTEYLTPQGLRDLIRNPKAARMQR